jgi:hypothetical protein
MNTEIYIVTKFGCDSGYNDMYTPKNSLFKNREEGYTYYTKIKDEIIKEKVNYNIDFWIDYRLKDNDGECIIQKGIDCDGAKRPIGVMIQKSYI